MSRIISGYHPTEEEKAYILDGYDDDHGYTLHKLRFSQFLGGVIFAYNAEGQLECSMSIGVCTRETLARIKASVRYH